MITCKYCGQELIFLGQRDDDHFFHCDFCDLVFPLIETSVNRKRKMSVPEYIDDSNFYAPVKVLLEKDTITLLHILKELRSFWFQIKTVLEKTKNLYSDNELPNLDTENHYEVKKSYIDLTKRKFIIENILLERIGFLPEKITEEFLNSICHLGEEASSKPMYVYIK